MSTSDTPRTDAAAVFPASTFCREHQSHDGTHVNAMFARQLERELNELRRAWNEREPQLLSAERDLEKAQSELNEARKQLHSKETSIGNLHRVIDEINALTQRNQAKETSAGAVERIIKELSAERAKVAKLRDLADWAEVIICNSLPMSHCTQQDWDRLVEKFRDQKHQALADTVVT